MWWGFPRVKYAAHPTMMIKLLPEITDASIFFGINGSTEVEALPSQPRREEYLRSVLWGRFKAGISKPLNLCFKFFSSFRFLIPYSGLYEWDQPLRWLMPGVLEDNIEGRWFVKSERSIKRCRLRSDPSPTFDSHFAPSIAASMEETMTAIAPTPAAIQSPQTSLFRHLCSHFFSVWESLRLLS